MARSPKFEPEFHENPRISANQLARFMLAKERGKFGIIRRAREKGTAPSIRYSDVRSEIQSALSSPVSERQKLSDAYNRLRVKSADFAYSEFLREDAEKSLDVLDGLSAMRNQYAGTDFQIAPKRQAKLSLSGVEVSVQCDLLVEGHGTQEGKMGGALLKLGLPEDGETESAQKRRAEVGAYTATLVLLHLQRNIAQGRAIDPKLCWSIDVPSGMVHSAPRQNTKRISELESACEMIRLLWDRV